MRARTSFDLTRRRWMRAFVLFMFWIAVGSEVLAQRTVDIDTRPGVTQRVLFLTSSAPRATLVMLPGGHGGLQLHPNGSIRWGEGNFLVRTRQLFVDQGFNVVVLDAPSDRQSPPFLAGFRQKPEHAADVKAVIAWAREQAKAPVWLIGTSRGTQSAAYIATELSGGDAPDGVVLTASVVVDDKSRPVPAMPIHMIRVPVLVVHHEEDGCAYCPFSRVSLITDKLVNSPRREIIAVTGGRNFGDPCEAKGHHGFNGLEPVVVQRIGNWILGK